MAITTMSVIREEAGGTEVCVPGFSSNTDTINLKLKRPSLIEMAVTGKIPNPLLGAAAELFSGKSDLSKQTEGAKFRDMAEVIRCVAKAALVEPSWDELHESGITLTDVQLLYIYNWSVTGVDRLKSFRKVESSNTTDKSGKGGKRKTEPGSDDR